MFNPIATFKNLTALYQIGAVILAIVIAFAGWKTYWYVYDESLRNEGFKKAVDQVEDESNKALKRKDQNRVDVDKLTIEELKKELKGE